VNASATDSRNKIRASSEMMLFVCVARGGELVDTPVNNRFGFQGFDDSALDAAGRGVFVVAIGAGQLLLPKTREPGQTRDILADAISTS
jgi:hypothetical protein